MNDRIPLKHARQRQNQCDRAIVLSGVARSGTSIIGQLLHSFANVEFAYEPPLLFSLFAEIAAMDCHHWQLLYETYLYEEILINSLAGRGLNCNRADGSSIFRVKTQAEIEKRLANSLRKQEAEAIAARSRIAYKMPDIVPFLPQLKQYYPQTQIILTQRKAEEVFASLLQKGWFSDRTLESPDTLLFPSRFVEGKCVPFWVRQKDIEKWIISDELHRIAYYYVQMNRTGDSFQPTLRISYGELVKHSHRIAGDLAVQLNLRFGEKTQNIINSISRQSSLASTDILDSLTPSVREEVLHYSCNN